MYNVFYHSLIVEEKIVASASVSIPTLIKSDRTPIAVTPVRTTFKRDNGRAYVEKM